MNWPVIVLFFSIAFFLLIFGAIICSSWYDAGIRSRLTPEDCEALAKAHDDLLAVYKNLHAPPDPCNAWGWRREAGKKIKRQLKHKDQTK